MLTAVMDRPLMIFSGQSNRPLAQSIAESLGVPLGKSVTERFANDCLFVRYEQSLREGDIFIIQSLTPPVQDHLVELLMMIDAAKSSSAARVTAVIPYYAYARSDKKDAPRISITARLVADLIQSAGADRVLTLTLHSAQVHGFFKIPVDHLSAEPVIANHFATRVDDLENGVVVAPDAGDIKRAISLARRLALPIAFIDKQRLSDSEVTSRGLVGDVKGKTALVVDDEVSTAGTLIQAVDSLKTNGAKQVYAAFSHGVYVGPAIERIEKSEIVEVAATDTCQHINPTSAKIKQLGVGPLFAEAIWRIHKGESVSSLFN
jgi:ribose-phosphate pyrophosphokinase